MNRYKKEMKRKYDEARKGLSEDLIAAIDLEDSIKEKIANMTHKIHVTKFPEEYDFMLDSFCDAKERQRGINPMCHNYIELVRRMREESGVSQLSDRGMPVSRDSYKLCETKAKEILFSDLSLIRPPAKRCVFCNNTIQDIGGKRLVAQSLRGIVLSTTTHGGGTKDYPYQSIKLYDNSEIYMVVWGEADKWTESVIARAKHEYRSGKQPWFCQICGERKCSECGSPLNYPMGSDILFGNGSLSHAAILPIDPGCNNPDCSKYKKWDESI